MPPDSDCETKISMAKANRRIAKPIMEKKRRARINASLNELKSLLVEVLQKEGCRHSSKMEKADILEMAVRHLKNLQYQQSSPGGPTHTLRDSYPPAIPLEKYASSLPPECLTPEMGQYLATKTTDSKLKSQPTSPDSTTAGRPDTNRTILPAPKPINISPQILQNPVMTRTATGEIAVVLPQHVLKQANNNGLIVPVYTLPNGETSQQPVMLSINMPLQQSPNSAFRQAQSTGSVSSSVTSSPPPSCPVQPPASPVWRPW